MIAERAPDHMACGWLRRSSVVSIQSMAPWRPCSTNSARRAPDSHGAAASAKPQTSKPRRRASARMVSEIEVVIVAGGGQAGPAVGQQGTETGPAFQLHVPGLAGR